MKLLRNKFTTYYLLFTIVIVGGLFRFYNLSWDEGHYFHPDERNIASAVSRIHFFDQLNPQFFAYGSLPIYLHRTIGEILTNLTNNKGWVLGWSEINLIGRGVSAFFSTLTIVLVFLLGKKIWGEKVGLLAALFTAAAVALIQTAHYGVTESLLTFWLLLLALFSFQIAEKPTFKNYTKAGLILGLAIATKVSAVSLVILPIGAHFLYHFRKLKHYLKLLPFFAVAFFIFAVFSPYIFLDYPKFRESMDYETGVVAGTRKVVYVLQFEKTFPYLFQIKNFFWQIGPIALLAILGIVILLFIALKKKEKKLLLFLSFPLAYFLYVGSWYTKFIRYMVPILPFLILAAAWFLSAIQKRTKLLGTIFIICSIVITCLWALAFFSIYTRPSTRITASKWIYQNIPRESKILTEHWDDGLPIDYSDTHHNWYQIKQLTIYESDNFQKVNYYAQELSQADYIIINSRRLYGTLIYLPEKYPITSRYYKLLFSGQLGYQKIAEFSSYPSLLGITVNDDSSEETFQVYEHPKVIILVNRQRLNQEQLKFILK